MTTVTFDQATRTFPGGERPAVDHLDLEIDDGEFLVLVGPSGCGKSTSLRMLAGLEEVDEGAIRIGETDVTRKDPKDRDVAMVFQNYALYPHMSVADNMAFALKIAGESKETIKERVLEAARLLDLEEYLDRKPKALSGGQRQRVAMGRAIVRSPQVFLMDEPLSNLDAKLRVQTRSQIAALQRRLGVTTVYVTHDQVEAMTMGDRVAVLRDGILQQVDTPRNMYNDPANIFVAGFIGSPAMNLLELGVEQDQVRFGGADLRVPREAAAEAGKAGQKVILGVRPEDMELVSPGLGLTTVVNVVEELGADAYVFGSAEVRGESHSIIARVDGRQPPMKGSVIHLAPKRDHIYLFSSESGAQAAGRRRGFRGLGVGSSPGLGRFVPDSADRRLPRGPQMDDDSDERSDQVRNALLKALALVVGIAVLIALGTTVMVRALGLDESDSPGPLSGSSSDDVKPLPTTALPVPGEKSEKADPSESPSASPDAKGDIQLRVSPLIARPMERVNFTGSYQGADNTELQVQRFDTGAWSDFGVAATVRVGTFTTYIMTGRSGENRFRVFDPKAKKGSNVIMVKID